ncbi:hypothetical protein WJX84_012090 [Apatococcus fuscideae]|uniref:Uncharacterized protein n=1 Tax=Apatococcus fuscideae TaxID=2026836 RepID=A0AAW1T211_9CHLO
MILFQLRQRKHYSFSLIRTAFAYDAFTAGNESSTRSTNGDLALRLCYQPLAPALPRVHTAFVELDKRGHVDYSKPAELTRTQAQLLCLVARAGHLRAQSSSVDSTWKTLEDCARR